MILAIETSSRVSSVAVAEDNHLLAEITTESKLTHSKTLVPHIESCLKLANKNKSDIKKVAVSIGPGSFTGLRIGLAAAKTIAYALKAQIIGAPTLKTLAYHFPVSDLKIVGVMDAQKNMAYRESYKFVDNRLQVVDELAVITIDEIKREVSNYDGKIMILGECSEKIYDNMSEPNVYLAPFYIRHPRAALVAQYAMLQNEPDNVMNLEPLYARRSEAEELWEKRHGK